MGRYARVDSAVLPQVRFSAEQQRGYAVGPPKAGHVDSTVCLF